MLVLALLSMAPLISLKGYKEKTAPADTRSEKASFKDLIRFFGRPNIWSWIWVLLLFRMSNTVVFGLLNPFFFVFGWSLDRIGFSNNILGPVFGIAGAVLSGWMVDRWRRRTVILITILFTIMAIIGLFITAHGFHNTIIIYAVIGLNMVTYGSSSTVMYTIIMDKSNPGSAGTDFSLQMSVSRIPTFIVGGLALGLVESIGYSGVLSVLIGIAVAAIVLICRYDDFEITADQERPKSG